MSSETASVSEPHPDLEGDRKSDVRRVLAAGAVGNLLEWFDFAIYGFMAPFIAARFFPASDPLSSLLAVYGAFAAGFLARPIGSAIFGHMGDAVGRKYMLIVSIMMMGVSTAAIGLLPAYDQIGPAAGALLVIMRIVQGISVGGEYSGASVFLAEQAPVGKRGRYASVSNISCILGFLIGSAMVAVMTHLFSADQISDGLWRYAFLSGAIIMIVGFFLRRSLDVPEAARPEDGGKRRVSPVVAAIRFHWRDILQIGGLALSSNVGFYILFVFSVTYLTTRMHVPASSVMDINTLGLVVLTAFTFVGGWLGDLFGRKRMLILSNAALLVLTLPLFWLVHHADEFLVFWGFLGFAVLVGMLLGLNPGMMAEIPERHVRVSVLSIGYNLAVALFAGTSPAVVTYLLQQTGNDFSPAYYLMFFTFLALLAAIRVRKNGQDLT
ncbi:MFS transporter [Roseibium sp. RKSG952]|uniref:MFS transporter n=1 Tax=Roseibium sp. RKSG952 TaxID=2529384 RepID=UPI0018AD2732|nr:MFS transporter [Roseibium sp. RKSG952]